MGKLIKVDKFGNIKNLSYITLYQTTNNYDKRTKTMVKRRFRKLNQYV